MIRPPLHEHLREYQNPHLGRLTYEPGCLTNQRTWLIVVNAMLGVGALALFTTAAYPVLGAFLAYLCLFGMVLPLTVLVPPFITLQAVNIAVDDANGQEFDVLRSTTLTDWQLGGGYVLAVMWRTRTFLTLLIGGWLAAAVTLYLSLVLLNGLGSLEFQSQNYVGQRIALRVVTIGVQQIGVVLLLTALPVALALRFGKVIPLTLLMTLVALLMSVGAGFITLAIISGERIPISNIEYLNALCLATCPWVLYIGAFWGAIRWVRHE